MASGIDTKPALAELRGQAKPDWHEIVVGNIGTVYSGNNRSVAMAKWNTYREQSREDSGRASGESVTWLKNGEIWREFIGSLAKEESL